MAGMCALLAEEIAAEREERRALVDAVGALARQTLEPGSPKSRVLGGSVYSSSPNANGDEIVLVDDPSADDDPAARLVVGTPVRCRFGDGWIGGLEVAETITDGNRPRYRLRRTADHYMLPARFERGDLEVAEHDEPSVERRWSRS
jgi:hypothetical protein